MKYVTLNVTKVTKTRAVDNDIMITKTIVPDKYPCKLWQRNRHKISNTFLNDLNIINEILNITIKSRPVTAELLYV